MDLNIIIENCGKRESDITILERVNRCRELGFHTIALSVIVDIRNKNFSIPEPPNVAAYSEKGFKVYSRLTAKTDQNLELFKLNKDKQTAKYDLLALEPCSDKILHYISGGSTELDILTFDFSERTDFKLVKVNYDSLLKKGVCLEINYGPAQLGSSLRRNIICAGQKLVEKCCKMIILSSGIDDTFRLRGPKDAECVGYLLMLPRNKCHDAVYRNGFSAIRLAKCRKNPSSSAIELVTE